MLIGYGNTLRGDDALGPAVAERLRGHLAAQIISCHQLTPELASALAEAEIAVFVDAAQVGPPGLVRVEQIEPKATASDSFTHHVTPAALLEMALALYGRAPRTILVTGTGADFRDGEGLSPQGRELLEELATVVPAMIRQLEYTRVQ